MKKGFTLIELLVVIAIIAVLSTIGLVSFQSASRSARDGKRKGDISQVRAALELYRSDQTASGGKYPVTGSFPAMLGIVSGAGYISAPLPADPKNVAPFQYYYSSASGATYCLCADLEGGAGNSAAACGGASGTYYCLTQP